MTSAELQIAVLQELGVLAAGESPTVEDGAIVDEGYDALYEMLLTEGLIAWTLEDDIPEFAERSVSLMVGYLVSNKFAVPPAKLAEMRRLGALHLNPREGGPSEAEMILRRQLAKAFVYTPMRTTYY